MKTLHLTLKREWFDAIASGTKREEYRDKRAHWERILGPHVGLALPWGQVCFRNGYTATAPTMTVVLLGLRVGPHNGRECYILSLGAVLKFQNYPAPK